MKYLKGDQNHTVVQWTVCCTVKSNYKTLYIFENIHESLECTDNIVSNTWNLELQLVVDLYMYVSCE